MPDGKAPITNTQAPKNIQAPRSKVELESEKRLQENVAALLRQKDIVFFRQRMDRRTSGTVGWPDFTFAVKGRACAVECKLPGEVLTDDQEVIARQMVANDWHYAVVTSERALLDFLTEVSRG